MHNLPIKSIWSSVFNYIHGMMQPWALSEVTILSLLWREFWHLFPITPPRTPLDTAQPGGPWSSPVYTGLLWVFQVQEVICCESAAAQFTPFPRCLQGHPLGSLDPCSSSSCGWKVPQSMNTAHFIHSQATRHAGCFPLAPTTNCTLCLLRVLHFGESVAILETQELGFRNWRDLFF